MRMVGKYGPRCLKLQLNFAIELYIALDLRFNDVNIYAARTYNFQWWNIAIIDIICFCVGQQ